MTAKGSAIIIGSTVGHGVEVMITAWPVMALQIPNASADFLKPNTSQKRLTRDPVTSPAIAPFLVALFQNSAAAYIERKAAAVIPNHIDVPTATILPGKINPSITAIMTAMTIPPLATITEDNPVLLVKVS